MKITTRPTHEKRSALPIYGAADSTQKQKSNRVMRGI